MGVKNFKNAKWPPLQLSTKEYFADWKISNIFVNISFQRTGELFIFYWIHLRLNAIKKLQFSSFHFYIPLTRCGTKWGVVPTWGTFVYNCRTTKAFNFKFRHSAQNLSGRVSAKFQSRVTPTYDVTNIFWQAHSQKTAILVYFSNFNTSFNS